jgi:hypothetical protein
MQYSVSPERVGVRGTGVGWREEFHHTNKMARSKRKEEGRRRRRMDGKDEFEG